MREPASERGRERERECMCSPVPCYHGIGWHSCHHIQHTELFHHHRRTFSCYPFLVTPTLPPTSICNPGNQWLVLHKRIPFKLPSVLPVQQEYFCLHRWFMTKTSETWQEKIRWIDNEIREVSVFLVLVTYTTTNKEHPFRYFLAECCSNFVIPTLVFSPAKCFWLKHHRV